MGRKSAPKICRRCGDAHGGTNCPPKVPTLEHPSKLYLQCLLEAQRHHLSSKTYSGKFLRPHGPLVKKLIDELGGVSSILDYGCGKGAQYTWVSHGEDASIPKGMTLEQFWGAPVFKYDPAWPPFSHPPPAGQRFDLVLCTHTLGSIPIVDLPWVIGELLTRARFYVYIAEKIGPVQKQVFSEHQHMPRWSAAQWREALGGMVDDWKDERMQDLEDDDEGGIYPHVWFASREKTEAGVIMSGDWVS